MTLDEAIKHAEDVVINSCSEACQEEHRNLVLWLCELKQIRAENAALKAALAENLDSLVNALRTSDVWAGKYGKALEELAALKSQEPVGYFWQDDDGYYHEARDSRFFSGNMPLFTAPQPATEPKGS